MLTFEFILIIMFAVLISAVVGQSIPRVSVPLVQIVIGALLSVLLTNEQDFQVSSELFLLLFIAPLLFDESRRVSTGSIWANRASITSLAVGLVVATLLAVGFALNVVAPSIPLAAAFALGAALGPTDAVAVSSLSDEVNLKPRQKMLLSGEALLNDASGVVGFQFAIAAAVTGAFSLADATATFLIEFFGGLGLGLVLGVLVKLGTTFVRVRGLESTTVHVLSEIVTPFAIYLIAGRVHVSGILAVVAAGLFLTAFPERTNPTAARLNVVSQSVWEVLIFIINGVVFTLLGLQLPVAIIPNMAQDDLSNTMLIACVFLVTFITIGVRFVWLLVMEWRNERSARGRALRLENALEQQGLSTASADRQAMLAQAIRRGTVMPTDNPIRDALVTTLSGPKGAVTLSIVFTLPYTMANGMPLPHRAGLVFIASGVIVLTLLLANFVVPILAPRDTDDSLEVHGNEMRIKVYKGVIAELKARMTPETTPATNAVIRQYRDRISHFREQNASRDKLDELNRALYEHQEQVVRELVDRGLASRAAGKRCLKRLRRARTLYTRVPTRVHAIRHAWRHPITAMAVGIELALRRVNPRRPDAEMEREIRKLNVEAEEAAVIWLGVMAADPDKETARAARLLLEEHEAALATAQSRVEHVGNTASMIRRAVNPRLNVKSPREYERLVKYMPEVEAEGLRLELELIQKMREDGTISRAVAADLREEVYVMQMDL